MEAAQVKTPVQFAVLVGINCYSKRPLEGCVRDIAEIADYLEKTHHNLHLQCLTADKMDAWSASYRPNGQKQWPTYQNFTSQLEEVISMGQAGDNVYIHFSGHGTRMEPSSQFSNTTYGDLALVLLEESPLNMGRYFRGRELAYYIYALVAKGLTVSLVLDCCFSGSVVRQGDDSHVRYLEYEPEVDEQFPQIFAKSLDHSSEHLPNRNGSMLPNWLIDPKGYTILAACGPHEVARELQVGDQRHGALSYLLCRVLTNKGDFRYRQQELYEHLCAEFKEHYPQQNPIFYGNQALCLFGTAREESNSPLIIVSKAQSNDIILQAGCAHGFSDGDRLEIYPSTILDDTIKTERRREAIIISTGPLTSIVRVLPGPFAKSAIRSGWRAETIIQSRWRDYTVQLAHDLSELQRLLENTERLPFLIRNHADTEDRCSLCVSINANNELSFLEESRSQVQNLPLLRSDQLACALGVIRHVIKYKQVKDLNNKQGAATFTASFSAWLVNKAGEHIEADQLLRVSNNEKVRLVIKNEGSQTLYVHVYNLEPRWQITNILDSTYEVLPARNPSTGISGRFERYIEMTVPGNLQQSGFCEDVLKIWITNQPTNFRCFEMPRLMQPSQASSENSQSRGSSTHTVEATDVNENVTEDWIALNFYIRTTIPRTVENSSTAP